MPLYGMPLDMQTNIEGHHHRLFEEAVQLAEKVGIQPSTASFPNVFTILQILATIPVTSCSCERSISCLRYLKNYLRGTMGEERLNGLAIMHAHRNIPLDLDEIIDLFASLHPRRMRMANILCSDD